MVVPPVTTSLLLLRRRLRGAAAERTRSISLLSSASCHERPVDFGLPFVELVQRERWGFTPYERSTTGADEEIMLVRRISIGDERGVDKAKASRWRQIKCSRCGRFWPGRYRLLLRQTEGKGYLVPGKLGVGTPNGKSESRDCHSLPTYASPGLGLRLKQNPVPAGLQPMLAWERHSTCVADINTAWAWAWAWAISSSLRPHD